eukprot:COSAG05_NODE_1652_length_4335_cov_49.472380_2_plen_69_part_00
MPFEDHEVADVVVASSHAAFLLIDGRVCRMGLGMNEKAVQEQASGFVACDTIARSSIVILCVCVFYSG